MYVVLAIGRFLVYTTFRKIVLLVSSGKSGILKPHVLGYSDRLLTSLLDACISTFRLVLYQTMNNGRRICEMNHKLYRPLEEWLLSSVVHTCLVWPTPSAFDIGESPSWSTGVSIANTFITACCAFTSCDKLSVKLSCLNNKPHSLLAADGKVLRRGCREVTLL
jgi:hypothetical protein